MQFLIHALDYRDAEALDRRMAARAAHVTLIDELKAKGHMLLGAALLNDEGQMVGSVIVAEFEHKADLDAWLAIEPYQIQRVWETVTITPCKLGPSFTPASVL